MSGGQWWYDKNNQWPWNSAYCKGKKMNVFKDTIKIIYWNKEE